MRALKLFITTVTLIALSFVNVSYADDWKAGWYEGGLQFTWLDQIVPYFYDLDYQLYLRDVDDIDSENLIIIDRTEDLVCTYLPDIEGDFLVGVNAIKVYNDEDILEGPVCWSDDPSCVEAGNVFLLRVKIVERGPNPDITKWRIIW